MKLYATTTSERASKGQGGNEYLLIDIMDEKKEIIAKIDIKNLENNYQVHLETATGFSRSGDNYFHTLIGKTISTKRKGKSQKGEHICCEDCDRLGEESCCVCNKKY